MHIRRLSWLSVIFTLLIASGLLASGCASIVSKPLKPTIELISVRPLNISLTDQKLRFELKVSNPNTFDMPIEAVDFIARFNNTNIASGKSTQSVTVGAKSDAILSLDVTAGVDRLASTLSTLLQGQSLNLEYELSGSVKVSTWPTPIPFDVIGAMDVKDT